MLQRAQIFDEKLRDVDAAAEALERLIAEIDPRNAEAHARLRHYYEQDDDWPRVVKIAERQAQDIVDEARREAREARLEMADWADSMLASLEVNLDRFLTAVRRGHQ